MTSLVILLLYFFFCLHFIVTMLWLNKLHGLESYTMGSGTYWQIASLMLSFDQRCYLCWKKRNCWLVQNGKMIIINWQKIFPKIFIYQFFANLAGHTLLLTIFKYKIYNSCSDPFYFACVVLQYVKPLSKPWSLIITFVFACLSCMLRIHQKHYMSHSSVIMSKDFHAI